DAREREVARPVRLLALRVLVPERFLSREADDEEVEPSVRVEVERPREEVVGVVERVERLRRVDLVLFLEARPLVPVGARDDVALAVAIEVAERRPLAEELLRELDLLERRRDVGSAGERGGGEQRGCDEGEP